MLKMLRHSDALLDCIQKALAPGERYQQRRALLIAIDGADGVGTSSLASWLAWQTGMPTVHLDLFLFCSPPIQWRTADLKRAVDCRLDSELPVIVEGVLVLDALEQIGRVANFVAFVKGDNGSRLAPEQLAKYRTRRNLPKTADFIIAGYSDEIPPV
jgi:hypothetical protein